MFTKITAIAALCGWALLAGATARAATIFDDTELAGATSAEDASLPQPQDFQVVAAGNYRISLNDLQTPTSLKSLRAIVTRDLSVVAQLNVTYPAAPAVPDTATKDFMATPGTYRIHVLAIANDGEAGGGFGVKVAPVAGGASLIDHVDVIAAQSAPAIGQSALQTSFTITQAGSYTLTSSDHAFPVALASLQTLVLQETDSGPVIALNGPGSFNATPGTYQLLAVASASGPALAGLYGIRIADTSTGAIVPYQSTQPVGNMSPATTVTIAAAGQHTLTLSDANFPATLSSLTACLTQGDTVLGLLHAAGTTNVTAAQGVVNIYALANPAAAEGVGSYSLQLAKGAQVVFSDIRTADASADPSTAAIYSFTPSAAITAGSYQLKFDDLAFPAPFSSLRAAVAQGATLVGSLNAPGTSQLSLQSGVVKVLVAAKPPVGAGNALFGITLSAADGGANIIESTQGVGGLFRTSPVTIPKDGLYDLALQDLEFPERMTTAQLAVTRGTTLVAQIIGGGVVPRQQLTAGTYVLNFLGQPAPTAQYGTYGMKVAESSLPPTVTLTASSSTITAGQSANLQWSSTDATTCSASNGWSGTKAASGTEAVGPLNASATFGLSCTGPGGTGAATLTVTVSPAGANGGGGGGGAFNLYWLAALSLLLSARSLRRVF
ncbi:MAG TPA: hypothetical protein VGN07_06870 [Steroidobacteraceae bacterium]